MLWRTCACRLPIPLSSLWTVLAFLAKWSLCGRSKPPLTHVKTFRRFQIEFAGLLAIQHTAHTMDGSDLDLEAFESNLRWILRARELDKTAALMSNLCSNAPDPYSVGISRKDDARRESHRDCCTSSESHCQLYSAAHHLIASRIRRVHRMITKYPQYGSLKGISTLLVAADPQGKFMTTQFWQRWRCSTYQLFLFLSTTRTWFTTLLPSPTGYYWNCWFEAMCGQNWRADDSGENG